MQNDGIIDTDLMSLINRAWEKSFARVDKNKNATSERGWNPLNKAPTLDPILRSTMTAQEKTNEYNQSNQVIIPNKHKNILVTGEDLFTSTATTISNGTTTNSINHLSIKNPPSHELSFASRMSQFGLKTYLTNEQLQEARES